MSQATLAADRDPDAPEILDVWSRTSRKHRVRTLLMLLLLAVLFAGLCCFTFWLRTGKLPWRYDDYGSLMRRSFNPSGTDQVTLSDFLSSPIPVEEVPIYAAIMGLQFASLSSIPILVAILYRVPVAVMFCGMVVFFAAMPWLGITVMVGCILACTGIFRFSFRYASALVGLIPVAIYLIMASWEPAGAPSRLAGNQALLYAPWVLALLGSCVICAVALAIARLINYRPGGIPPVLATLFVIPVILFHSQVGRNELAYRILRAEIGPGSSSIFAPVNIDGLARREAMRLMADPRSDSFDVLYRGSRRSIEDHLFCRAEEDRNRAAMNCDAFIEDFPTSRYVPNVLYLKARAQDYRIDRTRLRKQDSAQFRFDQPTQPSRSTWQTLIERFPDNELSMAARWRLAILAAGDGDLDGAIAMLTTLIETFESSRSTTRPATTGPGVVETVFSRPPASAELGIDWELIVRKAGRLREMLTHCRADKPRPLSQLFGPRADGSDVLVSPVQILMWFDEADPRCKANLRGLARAFAGSEAAGYAEVRLGVLQPSVSRRIYQLETVVQSLTNRPAGAEALFHLAAALEEDSILDGAKRTFEELVDSYPESCWAREAKQRLTALSILLQAEQ